VAPTGCGGGGGLLLLKRVGLQGVVVVDLLGIVVFDAGLPVVVVPLLLLLDLMLNVKNKNLPGYRYVKKTSWIRNFSKFLVPDPNPSVICLHKIITERYL
jgi:hypothetical protein